MTASSLNFSHRHPAFSLLYKHSMRPETVADEVAEIAKQYRNIHFEVVENFDGLPESVKAEAKARGYENSSVPGVWDPETDTVYINAEKAQPTNLEAIIFHEVVGHKGLHEVIPQRQWDGFLDAVYSRHFNDDDFKAVVRNYRLGQEVTKTDEESGIPHQERSVDDIAEQRYAAEEYLAHTAESGVKPGWWRETVAGVRTLLRRFFPNMRFTDNDIASALMRSARAMRRRRSAIAGMRYERGGMRYGGAEGTGAGARFAIIGEDGARTAAWRLDDLARAREMLKSGADMKTIRMATGWQMDAGKWKTDMPDLQLRENMDFELGKKLSDYVDAPELFAAYPELADVKLDVANLGGAGGCEAGCCEFGRS